VKQNYALDTEGANLSGLPENPPRVEALLYNMIEEEMKTRNSQDLKKKKEDDRAERLKVLQDQELARQVRMQPPRSASTETGEELTSSTPSELSEDADDGKGRKRKNATPLSSEDNWLQLLSRKEKRRSELTEEEGSLKKMLLTMEEKRISLEERRLQIEEQREDRRMQIEQERLSIDRQRAQNETMKLENERKIFEMAMRNNGRN
jgi:hypothetical protein